MSYNLAFMYFADIVHILFTLAHTYQHHPKLYHIYIYIQIETTHIKCTVPGGDTRWTHLALAPRYLATVFEHLQAVLEDFRPELVLYDAGVETRAEGSWLVVQ